MKGMFTVRLVMTIVPLGLLGSPCLKADALVRVHMIDAKTGTPIAGKPVRVWADAPGLKRLGYQEEKTGRDGIALFRFSDPLPTELVIHSGMGGYWNECSPNYRASYTLREILDTGFAEEGYCGNLPNIATKFRPKPGDVYIFPNHYNLWQRLTRCGEFGCR